MRRLDVLKEKKKEQVEKKLHNRFLWRGYAIKKLISNLFFSRVIFRPLLKAMKTSLGLLIVVFVLFCFFSGFTQRLELFILFY